MFGTLRFGPVFCSGFQWSYRTNTSGAELLQPLVGFLQKIDALWLNIHIKWKLFPRAHLRQNLRFWIRVDFTLTFFFSWLYMFKSREEPTKKNFPFLFWLFKHWIGLICLINLGICSDLIKLWICLIKHWIYSCLLKVWIYSGLFKLLIWLMCLIKFWSVLVYLSF